MHHMASSGREWLMANPGRQPGPGVEDAGAAGRNRYHQTMGPYLEPVLYIRPGDRVVVQTCDAFKGKLTQETDVPSQILEVPFLSPQNGPIVVQGAAKERSLRTIRRQPR